MIGLGAKSSSPAAYYSADSTAAAMAAGGVDRAAMDSPMAADYSLNSLSLESSADNGTAVYSEDDAAAAAHSTDHAKIIYTANLSLESKDYDAARAALDAAAAMEQCFVIGGASVYRELFPALDRVFVTKVEACPVSDSFFPNLDELPDWTCTAAEPWQEENGIRYQFCVYEKRKAD